MIDGLKPYPAMKDSGVPWLGGVPEHWTARRLRNLADMRVSNIDKHTKEDEQPVRLCNYVDVYKNDDIRASMSFMRATATHDEIARFRLAVGDVLITKDSEAWNDIGVPALVRETAEDLVSGYHLALLRPFEESISGEFLFRALQSRASQYQFHVEANGVTRYGLSHPAIKSLWLPVPPRGEQAAIVRFLDHADRRIRRYIRAKRKLIELLEEQKQAVVHQAVTGRIDVRTGRPYPAYKPSGVEWLGEVPEHWDVTRLKTLVSQVTSGSRGWSSLAADTGALFIRIANLTRTSINLDLRSDKVVRLKLPTHVLGEAARTRVNGGDILLSITAFIGSVAVVPQDLEEAYVSQHVACCRLCSGVANAKWVAYVLLSPVGQTHGQLSMYGGTKQGLSLDDVKNYVVLLPSRTEQNRIVDWIEVATSGVDSVMTAVKREIDLLREYRTRLIADVVTGKLDVREAAAKLPTEEADHPYILEEEELAPEDEVSEAGDEALEYAKEASE